MTQAPTRFPHRARARQRLVPLVAALALLLVPLASPPAAAQPGATGTEGAARDPAPPRWHYARLSLGSDPATDGTALVAGWVTSETSVFVTGGPLPLAERLAARPLSDTEDALIVLLNEVGARGWELVAVLDRGDRRDYLFKRPASE